MIIRHRTFPYKSQKVMEVQWCMYMINHIILLVLTSASSITIISLQYHKLPCVCSYSLLDSVSEKSCYESEPSGHRWFHHYLLSMTYSYFFNCCSTSPNSFSKNFHLPRVPQKVNDVTLRSPWGVVNGTTLDHQVRERWSETLIEIRFKGDRDW